MEKTSNYLSHAWKDLTSDKNWWKPVVILTLVSLIPIIGPMFVAGYALNWAREGAWGMDRSIPHKAGDIGKQLKWGFFSYLITFCWLIPVTIVATLFVWIPLIGALVALCGTIVMLCFAAIALAGCVNMAIYDRLKAGFQVKRLCTMASMNAGGLAVCFCIGLLAVIPTGIFVILCGTSVFGDMSFYYNSLNVTQVSFLNHGLLGAGPMMSTVKAILYLAVVLIGTVIGLLEYRAFGYWVGQFKPALWGGIDQPMPFEPGYTPRAEAAPTANQQSPSYGDVKDQVASAAATAGAFVKDKAEKAADAATTAAAGFKTEQVGANAEGEATVIEAEVVAVDDVQPQEQAQDQERAAPTEGTASASSYCSNCGAAVEEGHKFCVNCGQRL